MDHALLAYPTGPRPYPKTLCNDDAAQGTIPVRPPTPGASRMPQTLRITQSVLLSASFFLFLETGAGGRLNGPPDYCGAVCTKRPCFLRILSGKSSGPCCPCAFDVSSRPCHKALFCRRAKGSHAPFSAGSMYCCPRLSFLNRCAPWQEGEAISVRSEKGSLPNFLYRDGPALITPLDKTLFYAP